VSGEGTNLQALLDAELPVVAVASNMADARALERQVGQPQPLLGALAPRQLARQLVAQPADLGASLREEPFGLAERHGEALALPPEASAGEGEGNGEHDRRSRQHGQPLRDRAVHDGEQVNPERLRFALRPHLNIDCGVYFP